LWIFHFKDYACFMLLWFVSSWKPFMVETVLNFINLLLDSLLFSQLISCLVTANFPPNNRPKWNVNATKLLTFLYFVCIYMVTSALRVVIGIGRTRESKYLRAFDLIFYSSWGPSKSVVLSCWYSGPSSNPRHLYCSLCISVLLEGIHALCSYRLYSQRDVGFRRITRTSSVK
jgi:hypothetical protein